jgi:ubiquinol-cytochrome c reductase cytochrome c1 subunit
MIMKEVLSFLFALLILNAGPAGASESLEDADVDVFDQLSVLRGANYFANYCLGCHGLKQIRYSRIAKDLKINEAEARQSIMFGDAKIHDYMDTAMPAESAQSVFGVTPPDLSLVTRSRGADWVYTYLKSFYVDPKRPFGVNNRLLENVAMPNVLWELQGDQRAIIETENGNSEVVGVALIREGKMNERQFDRTVRDIVNFMAYVSEPSRLEREPLGKYVIAFMFLLTYVLYQLKKEYWKDID